MLFFTIMVLRGSASAGGHQRSKATAFVLDGAQRGRGAGEEPASAPKEHMEKDGKHMENIWKIMI